MAFDVFSTSGILHIVSILIGLVTVATAFHSLVLCVLTDELLLLCSTVVLLFTLIWFVYAFSSPHHADRSRKVQAIVQLIAGLALIAAGYLCLTANLKFKTEDETTFPLWPTKGANVWSSDEIDEAKKKAQEYFIEGGHTSDPYRRPYLAWYWWGCQVSINKTNFEINPAEKIFRPKIGPCSHNQRIGASIFGMMQGVVALATGATMIICHSSESRNPGGT